MLEYSTEGQEEMENSCIINKIIPFSNVDGPGNRCAIFVQGCNINCIYCHNSETINLCNKCFECIGVCPTGAIQKKNGDLVYNEKKCIECDRCINICKYSSSPKTKLYTVTELFEVIKEYKNYIRGITISGGEPTLNKEFIVKLFCEVKKLGLTCYIDTNGFFNKEEIKDLIDVTDKFLFDIKSTDNIASVCRTKSNNNLENLRYLLELDKIEEVRTVIIKDYFNAKETVLTVSNILENYNSVLYKLIKVHNTGLKDKQLESIIGKIPSDKEMMELAQLACKKGVEKVKYIL